MVDISSLLNNYSPLRRAGVTTAPAGEKTVDPRGKTEKTGSFTAVSMEFRVEMGSASSTGFNDQTGIFNRSILKEVDLSSLYSKDADISSLYSKEADPLSIYSKENPLSVAEAKELVGEDGYYGVKKTSSRIADFVISGAGDDIEKLRQGRKGILMGFGKAEKAWGGELPSISHETLKEALGMVDERISDLGGSIVDTST